MNCPFINHALYIVQLPKEIYISHLTGWQPFQLLNSCLHKSAIPNNYLSIICSALFSNIVMACTSILGSVAYEKLCAALTHNSLVRGIKQASPFAQTSCLEGFHSLLNQFAPKMIGYSYVGLYCRCVS